MVSSPHRLSGKLEKLAVWKWRRLGHHKQKASVVMRELLPGKLAGLVDQVESWFAAFQAKMQGF